MDIVTIHADAPTLDAHITAALNDMYPRVFLSWNPRYAREPRNRDCWQGRWEIWIELTDVAHPNAKSRLLDDDEWNTEAQCYMRYLQTYNDRDGSFAPADERLIVGLEMADTWEDRDFYERYVRDPSIAQEEAALAATLAPARGASEYYRKIDATSVGPYVNSGWRWRIN